MSPTYENFDLLIDRTQGGYRVCVIDAPAGQAQGVFALTPELEAIRAAVAAGWQIDSLEADRAKPWGAALYAALFAGEVESALLRSSDAAQRSGHGLRVRLNLTDAPELAALPWELAYSARLDRFLALATATPLVRYLALGEAAPPAPPAPPLAMLCVLADPTDLAPRLEVEREWQAVQAAVAPLVAAGALTLTRLTPPTADALRGYLRSAPVHLLHFVGHGWYDDGSGRSGLVLTDAGGQAAVIDAATLGVILEGCSTLRLLFLNACAGARVAERDAFQGTAQHLVRQGAPVVVAMQFDIETTRAARLAQEFYRALADGWPAEAAITEARKALFSDGGAADWATPVIFTRAADNRLVDNRLAAADNAAATPVTPRLSFEPEMRPIPAGPFTLGAADAPAAWRQHTVDLPAFAIGAWPITNAQYAVFARQHPEHRPLQSGWLFTTPPADRPDHPVTGITWHDAAAYCAWLATQTGRAYRLPTEAEWEKAARGVDARTYPWGEEAPTTERGNFGGEQTAPVTAHPAGCSPYGVCDLVGNVRTWTTTRWGDNLRQPSFTYPYRRDEREAASDRANALHICRGGAFNDPPALWTCSARTIVHADARAATVGLRVACDA